MAVPDWPLSDLGRARMAATSQANWVQGATSIWCSTETKAQDGAEILQDALGLPVFELEELGENDRSATGYVAPPEFWDIVDAFFAQPDTSIRGWERAADAQTRIIAALTKINADAPDGDALIVAHGGVGALAMCALRGVAISRSHDQSNQGNWFAINRQDFSLVHGWQALPAAEAPIPTGMTQ
ncbi:MAG: histidine phosphatase family protein [Hyphomicrobiales bacterium]|nr:MAG: histidine phosphatase family protein [Hyphomicrobiales bacterium]